MLCSALFRFQIQLVLMLWTDSDYGACCFQIQIILLVNVKKDVKIPITFMYIFSTFINMSQIKITFMYIFNTFKRVTESYIIRFSLVPLRTARLEFTSSTVVSNATFANL